MADVRGFLDADSAGAKGDEQRLRKARWRSQQGLTTQEGVTPEMLKNSANDKQKMNQEYIQVMNQVKKKDKQGE
jgi:hypothetical protein